MIHDFEDPRTYNTTFTKTGEKVTLHRRWCKCGHSLGFVTRKPMICTHCGNIVYPDDKYEFQERMMRKLKNEKRNTR